MNLFSDIKSRRLLIAKGFLFLLLGLLAIAAILYEHPNLRTAGLLFIAIWAFCRLYYFLFYVLENYAGRKQKYAGLLDAMFYLLNVKQDAAKRSSIKLLGVRKLIVRLSSRDDLIVEERKDAWLIRIPKGDSVCEVTIPIDWCFEWFACVKQQENKDDLWSDSMQHYGSPNDVLDAEMARDIEAFIERVTQSDIILPLSIYEESN